MKMKRFLTSILAGIMLLFSGVGIGCNYKPEYVEGEFHVCIKAEYKSAFLEKEFSVEDFQSEYIDSIKYLRWYDHSEPETGFICVRLKKEHQKYLEQVMQEVDELPFVASTNKVPTVYLPETF